VMKQHIVEPKGVKKLTGNGPLGKIGPGCDCCPRQGLNRRAVAPKVLMADCFWQNLLSIFVVQTSLVLDCNRNVNVPKSQCLLFVVQATRCYKWPCQT
jgi:hypothetical protein